jgi:hypothetical protein
LLPFAAPWPKGSNRPLSDLRPAAIYVKDLSGNESRRLEIEDRVHDVGDLPHAPERMQGAELRMCLDGIHRRLNDARCDRIHPDATRGGDGRRGGRGALIAVGGISTR